jgi:hypothetical protein
LRGGSAGSRAEQVFGLDGQDGALAPIVDTHAGSGRAQPGTVRKGGRKAGAVWGCGAVHLDVERDVRALWTFQQSAEVLNLHSRGWVFLDGNNHIADLDATFFCSTFGDL